MVRVDVWSDIACPWCWLGHAHLRQAAKETGVPIEVTFHAFQLAPDHGAARPVREYLLDKYGSTSHIEAAQERLVSMGRAVGLAYDFEAALAANTFDAHRLHHFAMGQQKGGPLMESLFCAQHAQGADVSDKQVLVRCATEAGLDPQEVASVLDSDAYADAVRADVAAARELGVTGVPFFVFEQRAALSGAQPVEVFAQALRRIDESS